MRYRHTRGAAGPPQTCRARRGRHTGKVRCATRIHPDYLALVGDAADGYPGLPGWGAKSTAAVLARYGHLETIPADGRDWGVRVTNPQALADTLRHNRDRAYLFRDLATLRTGIPLFQNVDELRWRGPTDAFEPLANRLDSTANGEARRGRKLTAL